MPQAVAEIFEPLRNELIGLHERWALYQSVFGANEEQFDMLKRIASNFFGYARWAMYLDLILSLCRYADPAESSKKVGHRPNLTLERLVNVVTANNESFGDGLKASEWPAVEVCRDRDFEEIRNKRIAHSDFVKMTARFNGQPIDWPSREQVKQFLTLCTNLMDKVHQHYVGCPFAFDAFASYAAGSGDTLIKVLAEFTRRHAADVEAGKARWLIDPPKGWASRLISR